MADAPGLSAELIRQATYRRGTLAVFDPPAPARTALLVTNLQNAWLAPGAPFRIHADRGADLALVQAIQACAGRVRAGGGQVVWLRTTVGAPGSEAYWHTYYDHFIEPVKRARAVAALTPGDPMHALHPAVQPQPGDWVLDKTRFSPFLRAGFDLERLLRERGADNVVVAGTATNICCEATVRDAMARDFRTFMPHDLVAAPTDDGHVAGLRNVMQAFADVRASAEILPGA